VPLFTKLGGGTLRVAVHKVGSIKDWTERAAPKPLNGTHCG